MIKVIGWIHYDNYNFRTASCTEEEIEAVAKNIKENGYMFGGDDHENFSNCCPLLSNGTALRVSWRQWGYIMALAYDLKTESGDYNYILWYMGEYGPKERKLPKYEPINLKDCPKGKTVTYELSDKEYHAINNAALTAFAMPLKEYEKDEIKTLDEVIFKYNGIEVLEVVINEISFSHYSIDEFANSDDVSSIKEISNFRDFDSKELSEFVKQRFGINDDKMIVMYFDNVTDNRDINEIYA